jgi:ABC-2 type transport system permease protein
MGKFESFKQRNTWDLIWELFRTDFKLKYNDSILGFLWVLMKPFSIFMIMYFILTKVFPSGAIENFPLYLLLGNMVMSFWNEGSSQGMDSLLARAGLITKVNFPRYIVLISSTLLSSVNFLINLSIFLIIALVNQITPTPLQFLWFLFCSFTLYLLIAVISMFLSITYVKFRDLKQIWELFNQLIFWATPVIYSIDVVAHKSKILEIVLTKLNPISVLLTSGRNAILYGDIGYQRTVFSWFGVILLVGIFGYMYYKRSIKRIAEFF